MAISLGILTQHFQTNPCRFLSARDSSPPNHSLWESERFESDKIRIPAVATVATHSQDRLVHFLYGTSVSISKTKCKLQAEDLSYIIGQKVRSLHGTAARRKVPSSRGKLQHNPIYTGTAAQAPSYNLVETCPMHCHSEVLVMFAHHLKDLFKRGTEASNTWVCLKIVYP